MAKNLRPSLMKNGLLLCISTPPENLFLAEVTFSGYIFDIYMGRDKIQKCKKRDFKVRLI